MKKKKQIKIIISLLVMIAVLFGGWGLSKSSGLVAKESQISSVRDEKQNLEKADVSDNRNLPDGVEVNEDGTKTFIAGIYKNITVSDIVRYADASSGIDAPLPWDEKYTGVTYNSTIGFSISIDNTSELIQIGDKIKIPLTTSYKTNGFSNASVGNIGQLRYIGWDEGYELSVEKNILHVENKLKINGWGDYFPLVMVDQKPTWQPFELRFNSTFIGTYQTTALPTVLTQNQLGRNYTTRALGGSGASIVGGSFEYTNFNDLGVRFGLAPPAGKVLPSTIVQTLKIQFEEDGWRDITTPLDSPPETFAVWGNIFSPLRDENDIQILSSSIGRMTAKLFRLVTLEGDLSSSEKIIAAMEKQPVNSYTWVIDSENHTITIANKMTTGSDGLTLTKSREYLESGANSPAAFFDEMLSINYSIPFAAKINEVYDQANYYQVFQTSFAMADDTKQYIATGEYKNNQGAFQTGINLNNKPNPSVGEGESAIKINFINEETGQAVSKVDREIGIPGNPFSITSNMLSKSGYVLVRKPENSNSDGSMDVFFPSEGNTTEYNYYYKKLPTIDLTKRGATEDVLSGVTMSIGARVSTSEGEKLMSLPALYKEMMGDELAITTNPLVTDDDGKIAMPSTDSRIATMWDLQSQGSGGNVQRINQWVFVETQAADTYQPSPFNTFDIDGGQSDISADYQNKFVFDITPSLELGEGKIYSATAMNKLNQFKVQPTAIGPEDEPLADASFTINDTPISNPYALTVGTAASAPTYTLKQTNTNDGYASAQPVTFKLVQTPNKINEFTVTVEGNNTDNYFEFYYKVGEEKKSITPGTPFTSSDFLENPTLFLSLVNQPIGDVEIEDKDDEGVTTYLADDIDFGNITVPTASTITKAPEANNGTDKDQYPSLVVKDTRLKNYREAGWTLYVTMTEPFRLKKGDGTFDDDQTIENILKYKNNFTFNQDGEEIAPTELAITKGDKIPIESLIPTATQLNETIWRTQVDLGAQKEENGEASKGFYLEINKPTQLGIKAGEYQAELTFSVENSAFTTTPTP